jgi:Pentatricopeptide repeat domain
VPSVLNALSHKPNDTDLVNKAESLVREMLEHSLAPNQITFTALIRTIVASTVTDKAQRARAVLQLMEEQGVPPSTYIIDRVHALGQHMDVERNSGDLDPDNIKK